MLHHLAGVIARRAYLGPELTPVDDVWMTFEAGHIAAIGTGRAPKGLVPLHGRVVLPGLVDCHVHLTMSGGPDIPLEMAALTTSGARELVLRNACAQVMSGVTTVRDLGSFQHVVVDMAEELSSGDTLSPSVVAAGAVSTPGGHGHFLASLAKGPEDYSNAARALIARGARAVKVFATGGIITSGSRPDAVQMSPAELRAVVAVAHELCVPVAAHAHGQAGIRNAVAAGVDSVEHFSYLGEEDLELVASSSTRLVCTLVATERFVRAEQRHRAAPESVAKIIEHVPHERLAMRRAVDAGLPLAVGTDAGTTFNSHGWGMQDQAESLAAAGMSVHEVLRCLTVEGSRLLGEPAGWLGVGRRADLLAVAEDPLADIQGLRQVRDIVIRGRRVPAIRAAPC
jgi:imidazolonepropionase-like amidohydrolase